MSNDEKLKDKHEDSNEREGTIMIKKSEAKKGLMWLLGGIVLLMVLNRFT